MTINAVATDILMEEGYNSTDELLRDWSLMVALTRVEQYRAECEFFERKYKMTLIQLEQKARQVKGQELFEQEEDLEDWEFSTQALNWWQTRVEELKYAINT